MIAKEIQKNEPVRFRVPSKVAEQIRLIKSECKKLEWKFDLNDEIALLVEKQCHKALKEIQAELDRRRQEISEDIGVEEKSAQVRSQKNKLSTPNTKPLPILIPGKDE